MNLITWWSNLSWPAATAVAFIAICAWVVGMTWLRATLGGNRRAIPPRRSGDLPFSDYSKRRRTVSTSPPWHLVDYSPQYREKSDWLGENGLLARPAEKIRRGSHEVGSVVKFERTRR